jgi:hypothetical protein
MNANVSIRVTPGSETLLLDHALRVVDEVLEPAVVEVGDRQAHQTGSSCGGIT